MKYDGKAWTKVNINTTKGISVLYFTDKDHGWLVGEGGLLCKYDGTSWTEDTTITTNDLYDIYMANSKYGWAVGDSGTILQYINNDTTVVGRMASADIPSTIFPNPS
ncbi:MAG: YCF48-related protein [Ginsengibacter sp.]